MDRLLSLLDPRPDPEHGPAAPWRFAWPYPPLAATAAAVGLAVGASLRHLLLGPLILALYALWRLWQGHCLRRSERERADSWFRNGVLNRARWRADELTAPRRRKRTAAGLRRMVLVASSPVLRTTAVVYERACVRANADLLLQLATRLGDLSRPVSPQGMVLLEDVLQNPNGPLYTPGQDRELGVALEQAERLLAV